MKNKREQMISAVVTLILAGVVAVLSVLYAKRGGAFRIMDAKLQNTIEIPLSDAHSLAADYGSKNLEVYVWQEDRIVIKEYLNSKHPEAKATVEYEENKAVVTGGKWQWNLSNFLFLAGMNERIEIYLPAQGLKELELHTGSGNIRVNEDFAIETQTADIRAGSGNIHWKNTSADEIVLYANSGNIHANGLKGNTDLHTGSGNITAKEIEGAVSAEAGSGNITIEKLSGSCRAKAGSGNLKIAAEEVTGDISMKTGSGNQRLELPEELSFAIEVSTGSGNIHTDCDREISYNKKGNRAEGQIGDEPVCRVTASAGSGNVTVKRD